MGRGYQRRGGHETQVDKRNRSHTSTHQNSAREQTEPRPGDPAVSEAQSRIKTTEREAPTSNKASPSLVSSHAQPLPRGQPSTINHPAKHKIMARSIKRQARNVDVTTPPIHPTSARAKAKNTRRARIRNEQPARAQIGAARPIPCTQCIRSVKSGRNKGIYCHDVLHSPSKKCWRCLKGRHRCEVGPDNVTEAAGELFNTTQAGASRTVGTPPQR